MKEADLIIVGGGVMGCFHAYHALKAGLKVTLYERSKLASGASVRNFGQIVPSGLSSEWRTFGRRSLQIYKELEEPASLPIKHEGTYYVASNPEELQLLREMKTINDTEAYTTEWLEPEEVIYRQPLIRKSYALGSLHYPLELSVDPRLLVHRLTTFMVENMGLDYHPETAVIRVRDEGGLPVAETVRHGIRAAKKILIASGNEVSILFPEVLQHSKLTWVKLQMLRLSGVPVNSFLGNVLTGLSIRRYECFSECPSWKTIKSHEPISSIEKENGIHILFKQEADGSVIVGDSHHYSPCAGSHNDEYENHTTVNDLMLRLADEIADLSGSKVEQHWNGWYTQVPDAPFFQVDPLPGVRILTGIGGKGMTATAGFSEHHFNTWFYD
jgi:FAD dependent oxidoreductase TIGR03364